jgi:hypothetical protein
VNGPRPDLSGANRVPIRSNNTGNNNQQTRQQRKHRRPTY